jgi:hypothetical protein
MNSGSKFRFAVAVRPTFSSKRVRRRQVHSPVVAQRIPSVAGLLDFVEEQKADLQLVILRQRFLRDQRSRGTPG